MNWFKEIPIIKYILWLKHSFHLSKRTKNLKLAPFCFVYESILSGYNRIEEETIIRNSKIGLYSYIEKGSSVNYCDIGKFCSIGPNFKAGQGIHPTNYLSTHPNFYSIQPHIINPFVKSQEFKENKITSIGNDVWIGANVFLMDGVEIGDGAIIAAGAVVTKNVEPYSVVGGVPSKFIRFRLKKETIASILNNPWWNNNEEWLRKNIGLFGKPL